MAGFRFFVRSVGLGILLRCPSCGRGRQYETLTRFRDECPECGQRFEPSQGEFTGAVMMGQGLYGAIAVFGYLILLQRDGLPSWWPWAWLGASLVALPVLTYRNLKGFWLGLLHGARAGPPAKPRD